MSRKRWETTRRTIGWVAVLYFVAALGSSVYAQEGPLGQFLKDLFGGAKPGTKKLDLIDRHAASASRELTRSLEQSDSLIAGAQWDQATKQLQYLIDLPEDALVLNGANWVSIKRRAEEKLLALPEEGRRFYLNQYEQVAHVELLQARARGDFEGICRVASRFRLTNAGQSAADEVASLLVDAGDLVAAAQWSLELERDKVAVTTTPEWQSRVASVLESLGKVSTTELPKSSLERWTEVYGGPTRLNSVAGDRPLLLEEWSSPASQMPLLQEDIERRQEDLFAGSHRPFPVANVVAAGGLMAVRSVGGLEVREVASGRLLWKTRGRNTVESQLMRDGGENAVGAMSLGPADNHEGHPLSSFFYRDAVLGQLSTDGKRVFAIGRKSALLSSAYDLGLMTEAEEREDRAFNTIVALDFATGRTLWTTGGSTHDVPFEAPLAGVYFFGPPTVDGSELFAIGVVGGDVNLYCLEASTGLPKWKQFIAQYDAPKIEDDLVRQMWACTPLVTRGLIYCPTNAGWLVAVDRQRHRLAWATRYATAEVSDRYQPQYTLSALNERWMQTAPMLAGGELVFAPPELPDEPMQTDAHLYRVDAVTGKVLFRRGKGDSLAVGGVYGETIVVLGQKGLEGWPPLPKWSSRWSTPYPEGLTPCGTGVAIDGVYWAPFLEGAVVGFRLSDGAIQEVLRNDALAGRLGNLIVNRDRVVSAGPTGIVGLWQKAPFEQQLVEQLAKNPGDLEARLRKARGLFSNQRLEETLTELESADLEAAGATELVREARDLQWKCLKLLLSTSKDGDDSRWKRLEELADSPEEKQVVARLQVDRSIASGRWQDALDRCWKMIDSMDDVVRDEGLSVRGDLWLSGRLLDIWTKAPEEIRTQLTGRIEERTKLEGARLMNEGPGVERLFGFHPLGRRVSLQLGLADAANGDLAFAETRLVLLAKAKEADTAAAAATKLADLYAEKGGWQDRARLIAIARRLDPETPLPGGIKLKAWLERQSAVPAETAVRSPMSGWNLKSGQVIRLGAERDFEIGRPIWVHGRPSHWMDEKRLEFSGSWYGLSVIDRALNRSEWTMPLAANGVAFEEWSPEATAGGNVLALCSRGMLHVCSPIDRSLLWSWPLPGRFATPTAYGWAEEQLTNQPVRSIATAVNEFQTNVGDLREGPLMAIAGGVLALLGQRELVVFDVRTGDELWRRDGMAASAVLVVDEETVCVSATAIGPPAAFRLRDGRQLESGSLETVFKRAFAIEGDMVLTRQGLPALLSSKVRIVAEKPYSGETLWTQAVTSEVMIHRLPGNELVGIEPSGEVFVIDVTTGARTDMGRLTGQTAGPRKEMHVLSDADRIYVAVHRNQSYEFTHVAIPSISLSGDLYVFDRKERRLAWTEKVREASLLTARFADSPVVVLAEHGVPQRRRRLLDALSLPELKLAVLDKRTGARVAEWSGVTQHGSPAALTLDPAKQRIDLFLNHYSQNFSDRLRVQFGSPASTTAR